MKKLSIMVVAMLMTAAMLMACTPGSVMDWLSRIDKNVATSGNAYFVTYGNAVPYVSSGNAALVSNGNAVMIVTSGNTQPQTTSGAATK